MCCCTRGCGPRRAWRITMWPLQPIRLGSSCVSPAVQAVKCCLASGLDPSVTPAEESFENCYHMPCPALEPALHAQPIILYVAVPFGFPFGLASADRMYIPVGGKAPPVRHPLRCIPVFPMGAPGCCACVVVRCWRSRPLSSLLGSDRGVQGLLCSLPCRASRVRWCVRWCLRAVAGGQDRLAWCHAGL